MTASFKIRTAPLDGIKVEEVLDPDWETVIFVWVQWV